MKIRWDNVCVCVCVSIYRERERENEGLFLLSVQIDNSEIEEQGENSLNIEQNSNTVTRIN